MNKELSTKLAGTIAPLKDEELVSVAGGSLGVVYDPTIVVVVTPGEVRTNSRSGGKQDDSVD